MYIKLLNYYHSKKSKKGFTLVEMICVICVLGILSAVSVSALFAASDEYKLVNEISKGQRAAATAEKIIKLYSKSAVGVTFTSKVPVSAKDILFTVDSTNNEIVVQDTAAVGGSFTTRNHFSDITKIDLKISQLHTDSSKFLLSYTITASDRYKLEGGIILNNVSGYDFSAKGSGVTLDTASPSSSKYIMFIMQ